MNEYIGNELELFKYAFNWKNYYTKKLKKYIHGDILEVGAGIGETTKYLFINTQNSWLCLEPDLELAKIILKKKETGYLHSKVNVQATTIDGLSNQKKYDCILYIDVLEHIEHDTKEIIKASKLLKEQGYLIILAPAHNFLFSKFDKNIGHYRRYNKKMFRNITNIGIEKVKIYYLDSFGLFASLVNRLFLKQDLPKIKQINFWDKFMIPISKITDLLSFYCFGKSIIGIWQKTKV